MKLLYDQNLSPVLVRRLNDLFHGSEHVFELDMGEAADHVIAAYAKKNGFAVVTKDLSKGDLAAPAKLQHSAGARRSATSRHPH